MYQQEDPDVDNDHPTVQASTLLHYRKPLSFFTVPAGGGSDPPSTANSAASHQQVNGLITAVTRKERQQ